MALTSDDIGLEQQKLIQNVQDLTEVESHVARQLLQEMKWNYEAVVELYYEDTEKLLSKAGVAVSAAATFKKLMKTDSGLHLGEDGSFTCQVCYDTFEGEEEMVANVREFVACGHAMCKSCWFQQLKTKIIDEGVSVRIACPGFSMVEGKVVRCNIILDERFVDKLLKEVQAAGEEPDAERTLKRYQKQLNDNYVNNNNCIKWCTVRPSALLSFTSLFCSLFCCRGIAKESHFCRIFFQRYSSTVGEEAWSGYFWSSMIKCINLMRINYNLDLLSFLRALSLDGCALFCIYRLYVEQGQ